MNITKGRIILKGGNQILQDSRRAFLRSKLEGGLHPREEKNNTRDDLKFDGRLQGEGENLRHEGEMGVPDLEATMGSRAEVMTGGERGNASDRLGRRKDLPAREVR